MLISKELIEKREISVRLFIAVFTCISSYHVDHVLFFVYFVKESVFAYSIPPGFGFIISQLLDIFPEIGILPELWVYKFYQLFSNPAALPFKVLQQIFSKLIGLKYFIFSQSICPFSSLRGCAPSQAS